MQDVVLPDSEQQEGMVLAGKLPPEAVPHTTARHAREELAHLADPRVTGDAGGRGLADAPASVQEANAANYKSYESEVEEALGRPHHTAVTIPGPAPAAPAGGQSHFPGLSGLLGHGHGHGHGAGQQQQQQQSSFGQSFGHGLGLGLEAVKVQLTDLLLRRNLEEQHLQASKKAEVRLEGGGCRRRRMLPLRGCWGWGPGSACHECDGHPGPPHAATWGAVCGRLTCPRPCRTSMPGGCNGCDQAAPRSSCMRATTLVPARPLVRPPARVHLPTASATLPQTLHPGPLPCSDHRVVAGSGA